MQCNDGKHDDVELRLELNCGGDDNEGCGTMEEASYKQKMVIKKAKEQGIRGYHEESSDRYGEYSDGYVYPTVEQLPIVLKILEEVGWEGDYLDVPDEIDEDTFGWIKEEYGKIWNVGRDDV